MTKVQMESKLALLPLLSAVAVGEELDEDNVPRQTLTFTVPAPGSGTVQLGIYVSHTEQQLRDLVNNLPLDEANRLAALAIMLIPVIG